MPRWEVIISDTVTGKLVCGSEVFTAGRTVTENEVAARWLATMDSKRVRVRELSDDEPDGEPVKIEPAKPMPRGPLTLENFRNPTEHPPAKACFECGLEFADIEAHRKQSGHQITEEVKVPAEPSRKRRRRKAPNKQEIEHVADD